MLELKKNERYPQRPDVEVRPVDAFSSAISTNRVEVLVLVNAIATLSLWADSNLTVVHYFF